MRPEAIAAMTEAMEHTFGNASPSYSIARDAKRCLDNARAVLAETIGAGWNEIFFTSGGTESDNWALTGTAEALQDKGPRHPAYLRVPRKPRLFGNPSSGGQ